MGAAGGPAQGSRVCRLRGLPYSATQEDVRLFFEGYLLEEVYLCKRDGRSTGEAYVVFKSPLQASGALDALNKKYMGSRYIELFEAAEADLAAVKHVLEDTRLQGSVVRLRGLPYTATAADIARFFQGIRLAEGEDAIVITQTADGRTTGEAYVELADQDAYTVAMTRHKEVMGSRYIEVFHSSKIDKLQAVQQQLSMPGATLGRWNSRCMVQPDMVAAAAAAGMRVISGALMQPDKPLNYVADQLADSLQGTHLNSSSPMALAANGVPQHFMLPPGAMPIQPTAQHTLMQQHQQQLAVPAAGSSSSSSLSATTVALSSTSSGLLAATCGPVMVSGIAAVMQPQQLAILTSGGPVQQVAYIQQQYNQPQRQAYQQPYVQYQQQPHQQPNQQHMRPMSLPPAAPHMSGAPQMMMGPGGQALGPAMYSPVQQGMVAAPYAMPPYPLKALPMPMGPPEQPMMSGPIRLMLVRGGQWTPRLA